MAYKALPPVLSSGGVGGGVGCLAAPLHLASYNLGGLDGQGHVVLTELCSQNSNLGVIMLQEHWLTPDRMTHLQNFSPFFYYFWNIWNGTKNIFGNFKGAPIWGAALMVHTGLLAATTSLLITECVNVIRIGSTLFINVYCPIKSLSNRAIISLFLDEIAAVITTHSDCEVIMGGDFNVDLRESSPHSKVFQDFMTKFNLKLAYDIKKTVCDYTFFRDSLGQKTMIDFFIISDPLRSTILHHEMRDDMINLSDHLPLMLSLNIDVLLDNTDGGLTTAREEAAKSCGEKRLRWDHAPLAKSFDIFFRMLSPLVCIIDGCLSTLVNSNSDSIVPGYLSRSHLLPHKSLAISVIEGVYNDIVDVLHKAAALCIPSVAPRTLKHWWHEELNTAKKESQFHYTRWRAAQKPNSGSLFDHYIKARKDFRNKIKQRKFEVRNTVNTALLEALNSTTDFWSLWKSKLGKIKKPPASISGATGGGAIAAVFAKHFSEACSPNSLIRSEELHAEFIAAKSEYIINDNLSDYLVTQATVTSAIEKLKKGKSPGADSLSGEHIVTVDFLFTKWSTVFLTEYIAALQLAPALKPN